MAFVNEFVSEEDIQRFGLDELMRHFNPLSLGWSKGRPEAFRHTWTIDRERGLWLMEAKWIEETGPTGRNEPTTKRIFILDWQGERIRFLLDRTRSPKFSDSPFYVKWSLLEMHMPATLDVPRQTIISLLKEALVAYGDWGARSQVTNTLVTLSF